MCLHGSAEDAGHGRQDVCERGCEGLLAATGSAATLSIYVACLEKGCNRAGDASQGVWREAVKSFLQQLEVQIL